MSRIVLAVLVVVVLASCHRTTKCNGTITGPEFHRDSVQLRCR